MSLQIFRWKKKRGVSSLSQVSSNNNSNGLSIAALVCGILGIVGGFIPVVQYFTLVLSILGVVFGVMGRKRANGKSGLATAGLVLGVIGLAVSLLGVICVVVACSSLATLGALA